MPLLVGCGSFQEWRRPDGSSVAVVRDINGVWPMFAQDVKSEIDANLATKASAESAGIKLKSEETVHDFYDKLDQVNGSLRTLVVTEYTIYVNTELDPDAAARAVGRARWEKVLATMSNAAMRLRAAKDKMDDAISNNNADGLKGATTDVASAGTVIEAQSIELPHSDIADLNKQMNAMNPPPANSGG